MGFVGWETISLSAKGTHDSLRTRLKLTSDKPHKVDGTGTPTLEE
jgi:hypothetical protein